MAVREKREVRVFVSSTFRDMQAERDELVKFVFPQLRKLCEERGVIWGEVDLRWGISDEQKAEGRVLPICLDEIERCRPYFIGLLGERYGWVPDEIDAGLIERQPWLAEHRDQSVTELEIIHGVLRNPEMGRHALFYFRDPAYVDRLPAESRDTFREPTASAAAQKLDALKDRIRASGLPLQENYTGPTQLAEWVLQDLTALLDREFPVDDTPDPLDREAAEHESIAQRLATVYIGGEDRFARLDAHVSGDGPPLVVLGDSGSGKSALLANWALRYRDRHADTPFLLHFIGASPYSADWTQMLRRIMGELKRHFAIPDDIPDTADALREAFPLWLAHAAAHGRHVLVLDALNQLEDRDAALDLGWLPMAVPHNIRLIVSTLPGRSLAALEKRGWPSLTVESMDVPARARLLRDYLAHYRKSLNAQQVARVAGTPECANPLYLKALLEEIRVFGVHEELDARIEHYLETRSIPELYRRILQRYEADYERDRPGLVRDAMRYLWAARRGLTESELLDLLGKDGQPMPRAYWAPVALASNQAVVNRSGLLGFAHDYLRQAVEEEYLPDEAAHTAAHLALADYFDSRELSDRKVTELPWQLMQAGPASFARLKDCITDIDLFMELRTPAGTPDLRAYWLRLGDTYDIVEAYREAIDRDRAQVDTHELAVRMNAVGFFLNGLEKHDAAESLYRQAMALFESELGQDHTDVAHTRLNMAAVLRATNRHQEAEPLIRRALETYEASFGSDHPNVGVTLLNLAALLAYTGRPADAEPLYRRALGIFEVAYGPNSGYVARAVNNFGSLLEDTGRYAEAESMYRRAIDIVERTSGPEHLDIAMPLNNLAVLMQATNRHTEAEPLYRRVLDLYESALGPHHSNVATALGNLASLLGVVKRYEEAERLLRRALAISESVYGPDHPEVSLRLNNLALLLEETGRKIEAVPLLRRALAIDESSFGLVHPQVALRLSNLAGVLHELDQLAEAEPLYQRALAIDESIFGPDHSNLSLHLGNLGRLFQDTGRVEEAEPLLRRALAINEKALGPDHPKVSRDLNNLAALLARTDRSEEAERMFRRAMRIDEASFGPDHPDLAMRLNNLAILLQETGRLSEAEELLRRALSIDRKVYGSSHPTVALREHNLARNLHLSGELNEAVPLYRHALEVFQTLLGPNHVNVLGALSNLADLLEDTGEPAEAYDLHRRALAIDESSARTQPARIWRRLEKLVKLSQQLGHDEDAAGYMRRMLAMAEEAHGSKHPEVAVQLFNLADHLRGMGQAEEAVPLYRRAIAIDEAVYGPDHIEVARDLNNLGEGLRELDRPAEAESLLRRALEIFEREHGVDSPDIAEYLFNTSEAQREMGRLDQAETLRRRVVEIHLQYWKRTGVQHTNHSFAVSHYTGLLEEMGLSINEIDQRLAEIFSKYGVVLD